MNFFKKRKEKLSPAFQQQAASRIARSLERMQRRWAAAMDKGLNGFSRTVTKGIWISFCLLLFAYSTALIAGSFNTAFKRFQLPHPIDAPIRSLPAMGLPAGSHFSEKQMVERIRRQLDSIGSLPNGRRKLDSLQKLRPGLIDSLNRLEKTYCER